jgi:THO complex subunit 2
MLQYLELLRTFLSVDDFEALFPSLVEMIADYHVEPDVAFTIARAGITARANAFRAEQRSKLLSDTQTNGDVVMSGVEESQAVNGAQDDATSAETSKAKEDVEMKDSAPAEGDLASVTAARSDKPFLPDVPNSEVEILANQLKEQLPETFGNHPCVSYYVAFWQLSLTDVVVDVDGINQQYKDSIETLERQLPAPVPERRGYRPNVPKADSESVKALKENIARIKDEQQVITKNHAVTQESLKVELRRWFEGVPMMGPQCDVLHNALLQDCFIPRSRISQEDAQYAFSMLIFMHSSGVPGFRMSRLLDMLFNANRLTSIISMYTEAESSSFGRFLGGILRELQVWQENKDDAFVKNAHGLEKNLPGFGRSYDGDRNATSFFTYDQFCMVLFKWHKALAAALKTCLESGNYMQMRNSINVLHALGTNFPKVTSMGTELKEMVVRLKEGEERQDLMRSLESVLGPILKGEKFWQEDHVFRNVSASASPHTRQQTNALQVPAPTPAPGSTTNGSDKAATEKGKTPQPQDAKLDAAAPAFKPKSET